MDLNQHIGQIVEGLVADITSNVMSQVDRVIAVTVANKLDSFDLNSFITEAASNAIEKKVLDFSFDSKRFEQRLAEKIKASIDQVMANTAEKMTEEVNFKIKNTNFNKAMSDAVSVVVSDRLTEYVFPVNSIHANALNFSESKISGDSIRGGIIKEFSSTGIDDRASNVALTILDEVTVVENNLVTKDLTVQGLMTVNGDFVVNGSIPKDTSFYQTLVSDGADSIINKLDNTFFNNYSNIIFEKIKKDGIDLNRITYNDKVIIDDNKIGPTIVDSNLQKLGLLKELQVTGESLLGETLYVNNKRIGINTIEPSASLAVWDDEVEITISKKRKDTGYIGTPRQQALILSSNNKENIVLESDGSVRINDLQIGNMKFTSSESPPNYVSTRGHIVWNNNPNPGGPMGWVCLGSSNWANFGIID